MRLHREAAGDARHVGGQLQRGDLDIALADAAHDRVAHVPRMPLPLAPFPRRDQPAPRRGQLDVQVGAQPHAMRQRRDPVDADPPRGLVEEYVARVLQSAMQIEQPVAALLPAVEPRIADIDEARALDAVAGRQHPRLQRGQAHRHLEGRAWRVHPRHRLVDQRGALVGTPLLPLRLADAGIEQRRVEGRVGGHGQHLAVGAVHHHATRTLVAQMPQHRLLQLGVDGQADFGAWQTLLPVQLAHHAADRADFELHLAGAAA
jgi:hypothetical protein